MQGTRDAEDSATGDGTSSDVWAHPQWVPTLCISGTGTEKPRALGLHD